MNLKGTLILTAAALILGAGSSAQAQHQKHERQAPHHGNGPSAKGTLTCPVMKAPIKDTAQAAHLTVNNEPVYVCCPGCIGQIKKEPAKYLKQAKDPVTAKAFAVTAKSPRMEHRGALFLFASAKTHETFHAHPGKYGKPAKVGSHGAHPKHHGK